MRQDQFSLTHSFVRSLGSLTQPGKSRLSVSPHDYLASSGFSRKNTVGKYDNYGAAMAVQYLLPGIVACINQIAPTPVRSCDELALIGVSSLRFVSNGQPTTLPTMSDHSPNSEPDCEYGAGA